MKKIISLLLAFSLLTGVSMTANAEDIGAAEKTSVNNNEPQQIDIGGSFLSTLPGETYYVDIKWSGMQFTYHEKQEANWDPDELEYTNVKDSYWESSDSSKNTCGTIKVTNVSAPNSDSLEVSFAFEKNSSFGSKTVAMQFSTDDSFDKSTTTRNSASFIIAAPTAVGMSGETGIIYVVPGIGKNVNEEDFNSAGGNLGKITITIAPEELSDPGNPDGPQIFD